MRSTKEHDWGACLFLQGQALEEKPEHSLAVIQEITSDAEVLGVFVSHFANAITSEFVDARFGIGHQDGRMRGDNELRAATDELINEGQRAELALWRECGFWLVEDVEAVSTESIREQRDKRLAMRLLVQGLFAVGTADTQPFDLRRHIVEAFCAQEVAVLRAVCRAFQDEVAMKFGM